MTDAQVAMIAAAIPTAATVLGALLRGAAIIVRDSRLEITKRWEDALRESNAVIRENSQAFADLRGALGIVDARTQDVGARVVEIHRETSDVHAQPPMPPTLTSPQSAIVEEDLSFDDHGDTPVEIPQPRANTRERDPQGSMRRSPAMGTPILPAPQQPQPRQPQQPQQPRAQTQPFVIIHHRPPRKG